MSNQKEVYMRAGIVTSAHVGRGGWDTDKTRLNTTPGVFLQPNSQNVAKIGLRYWKFVSNAVLIPGKALKFDF